MKNQKLIKTFADKDCNVYNLIKANGENSYFMEVLYYYVRRSLFEADFNLYEYDGFNINGKYLGYKLEVNFGSAYDNVIQSLSFALSVRALMLNPSYIKNCYDSRLLFYTISDYLTWASHRIIMECINDEDFLFIYQMIVDVKEMGIIDDINKQLFKARTIRPEFHHLEDYCKLLAKDPDYNGKSVIKNNAYLCSDIEEITITKAIDYVGDTAFSYCENLKEIKFEKKVFFGKFPIIECKNLKRIVVPTELQDYYKEALPYYKNIITDRESDIEEQVIEKEEQDLEIEHVYVDIPSAESYIETEVDQNESEEAIDFSIIEKVFDKKATSYKFFWLLAILDIFYYRRQITIPYKNIVAKMAAYAWSYVFEKNVDFGPVDQMTKYLCEVKEVTKIGNHAKEGYIEETILEEYDRSGLKKILSPLLKNVPYRFLSPWIPFTTQEDVIQKSYNYKKYHGVYGIYDEGIILNAEWLEYFRDNYQEIRDFVIKELERSYSVRE